jgi:hypothetical protein
LSAASEVSMLTSVLVKWPYMGVGMRPPFASGWSVFAEKLERFMGIGGVKVDIPFDLRRAEGGFFQEPKEGGGMSVMSMASPSEAFALLDRKLLALLGAEMLNADRLDRRSSSSTSSSEDSTGVRVGGMV